MLLGSSITQRAAPANARASNMRAKVARSKFLRTLPLVIKENVGMSSTVSAWVRGSRVAIAPSRPGSMPTITPKPVEQRATPKPNFSRGLASRVNILGGDDDPFVPSGLKYVGPGRGRYEAIAAP